MGTIYRRYAGMDELLRAVCEQAMREWVEAADTALATDDPWKGLVSFIHAAVGFRAGVFEQAAGSFTPTPTMIELAGHGQELLETIVPRAEWPTTCELM